MHIKGVIKLALTIEQQRPGQLGLFDIAIHHQIAVEAHDSRARIPGAQLVLVIAQLRDVVSARQSTQMPVEDQHEPLPRPIAVGPSLVPMIGQAEVRGLLPDPAHV
jgi:hypothetical protein